MAYRLKNLVIAVSALVLGAATAGAIAQPRGHGPGGGGPGYDQRGGPGPGPGYDRRGGPDRHGPAGRDYGRQDLRPDRMADRRGFPPPRADWRRGGYVPYEYRHRQYVIDNYRGYGLRPPPRGYQWVGVGGDFVLAAIATGLIVSIISH